MNFQQLIPLHLIENFIIFGENQNIVKTAKVLFQTQPSTSRQLELFQNHFKRHLFKREGRKKVLTEFGWNIHNYYKKNILELHELQKQFYNQSFLHQPEKLTISSRIEILQTYIAPLKFSGTIELQYLTGETIRKGLEDSKIDIAVYPEHFDSFNYFRKKLFSSEWRLVTPKTWGNFKNFEELFNFPFATYNKSLKSIYSNTLNKIDFDKINVQFLAPDWRIIANKIEQQSYWSIIPQEFVPKNNVENISFSNYLKSIQFYLYFRKELSKNKDVQNIINQLTK